MGYGILTSVCVHPADLTELIPLLDGVQTYNFSYNSRSLQLKANLVSGFWFAV